MGYEFFCGIPMAVGATLAMVLGLFITLERLEEWTAGKPFFEIMKNFFVTPTHDQPTDQQANVPHPTNQPAQKV
jgi:hypothetical protein